MALSVSGCSHSPRAPWRGMRKVGFAVTADGGRRVLDRRDEADPPGATPSDSLLFRCDSCGREYAALRCCGTTAWRGSRCRRVAVVGHVTCPAHLDYEHAGRVPASFAGVGS